MRRTEASARGISFDKHSFLIERTQRPATSLRLGLRGGSRMGELRRSAAWRERNR